MTVAGIATRSHVQLVKILANGCTATPNVDRDRVNLRKKVVDVVVILAAVIRGKENRRLASKLPAALDQLEKAPNWASTFRIACW